MEEIPCGLVNVVRNRKGGCRHGGMNRQGNYLDWSLKGIFCRRSAAVEVNSHNFQVWAPDFSGNIFLWSGEKGAEESSQGGDAYIEEKGRD